MKVKELIEFLQECDPQADVIITDSQAIDEWEEFDIGQTTEYSDDGRRFIVEFSLIDDL